MADVVNDDEFGDTWLIREAFAVVDPDGRAVRVPPAGNLVLHEVLGNANCPGNSLPCIVGAPGSTLQGKLPGHPDAGHLVFRQDTYVIQPDDHELLEIRSMVRANDLCDSPTTIGCNTLSHLLSFTSHVFIDYLNCWAAQSGLWSDAGNWAAGRVPVIDDDAVAEGANSIITLDTSPVVQTVSLSGGATIETNADSQGPVQSLSVTSAPMRSLGGTLRARDGFTLVLASSLEQSDGGLIEATLGGVVRIDADVTGNGGLIAREASVEIRDANVSVGRCVDVPPPTPLPASPSRIGLERTTMTAISPSSPNDMNIRNAGVFSAADSSSVQFAGPVSVCPDSGYTAMLELVDSSFETRSLFLCTGAELHVEDSTLIVGESFIHGITDATDHRWSGSATLQMIGGVGLPDNMPRDYATLEVAGSDDGLNGGFVGGFAMPKLVIGVGAHVSLVDTRQNAMASRSSNGSSREALYVATLEFADASGRLNVSCLSLYYQELLGTPSQIVVLDKLHDSDGDCDVDLADFAHLLVCLGGTISLQQCVAHDADEDGFLSVSDAAAFSRELEGR